MYYRRKIAGIITFTSLFVFFSCSESKKEPQDNSTKDEKMEHQMPAEDTEISGMSLFQLETKWRNQDGEQVQLSSLRGKPFIMAMIYTHCNYSCPRIVADMKEIDSLFPKKYNDDIHFLLVSIDPENDTPDTLKVFLDKKELPEPRWKAWVGEKGDIRELAAVLGFNYKKTTPMDFAHSNLITAFNAEGEQIHQIEGHAADKSKIVNKVVESLN